MPIQERISLAKQTSPHSEIVSAIDPTTGKRVESTNPQAGAMSGADPVGELVVGTTGGNALIGLTKLALTKTGSNAAARWARNSLLSEVPWFRTPSAKALTEDTRQNYLWEWTHNPPDWEYQPYKNPTKIETRFALDSNGKLKRGADARETIHIPVSLPEVETDFFNNSNSVVFRPIGTKQWNVVLGMPAKKRYDFSRDAYLRVPYGYSREYSNVFTGAHLVDYPEDQLIHYSSDLMPIKNGKFQPKFSSIYNADGTPPLIWWSRNEPFAINRSMDALVWTKVPHINDIVDNRPTIYRGYRGRFDSPQNIYSVEHPIKGAESLRSNPYTGFLDLIKYE